MPTPRSPTRRSRPAPRSTSSWRSWSARRWPTPMPRPGCSPRWRRGTASSSQPWDWAYYSERVRAERYDVDTAALRPYFDLERVLRDGVFDAARQAVRHRTGAACRPRRLSPRRPGLGGRGTPDGTPIGLFLGDYFAREGKRGGAWMTQLRRPVVPVRHSPPVVVNVLNVPRPAGRRTRPADPRRGPHPVPRVRARPARAVLPGHLSQAVGHRRARGTSSSTPARSTRCGSSGRTSSSNYARHVDTGEPLSADVVAADPRGRAVGRGFRHHRISRRDAAGPGVAPHRAGHGDHRRRRSSSGRP